MATEKGWKGQNLYPDLAGCVDEEGNKTQSTDRILVSDLPSDITEDSLVLFFGSKKRFNVRGVLGVDYDSVSNTAVVIFNDAEDVERIINKKPILYGEEVLITVERHFVEDEKQKEMFDRCTIEVTGMNQKTSKYTLLMYFESEKASGDEVVVLEIDYVDEDEMYLVRFKSEEVVDAIIERYHKLDNSDLNVRKHIPLPPDATYPKQVFVGGFSKNTAEETLVNFLEARSKKDVDKIIYGEVEGTAIALFKNQPDVDLLKAECRKKRLGDKNLIVDSVPVSKCIIVSNIKPGTRSEAVEFYFDNQKKSGVTGVERVDMDDHYHTCIVYFVDCEAPITACKKPHVIEGTQVKTDIYQECLGGSTNSDGPRFKPLDPLVINLDKRKAHFLSFSKPFHEDLNKNLKIYHAEVQKWPENKVFAVTIKCLLTSETKDCKKLAKMWEGEVKKCLEKILSSISVKDVKILQDAWKQVKDELSKINISEPERVGLSLEASEFTLYIVGFQRQVNALFDQIQKIVEKIITEIERKKQQVKETVELKPFQIDILMQLNFKNKGLKSYKNLQVIIDVEKGKITFDGLSKEVTGACLKMFEDYLNKIRRVPGGQVSKYKQTYASRAEVSLLINEEIRNKKRVCFWEIKDDEIIIHAMSDKEAVNCLSIFNKYVNETVVEVQQSSDTVLSSALWREEVEKIKGKYVAFNVDIFSERGKVIILSTNGSKFGNMREDVQHFLVKNTICRQEYKFVSTGQGKLIESQLRQKLMNIEKGLEKEKVKITITSDSIVVEGNEAGIGIAAAEVDVILKDIQTREHTIKKPGIAKYIMRDGKKKIESTEKEVGVIIEADIPPDEHVETSKGKNDCGPREQFGKAKPFNLNGIVEVAKVSLSGGPVIIAALGDITLLTADVIVNAANTDLDHKGGLAKVIASKGGKVIQDECTKYLQQNGSLSEGKVFFSKAGNLKYKKVCHAVGPTWKGGRQNEEEDLKNCVLMSLAGTDEQSYSSIAFPAISTGIFGYPVEKASNTIIGAVEDYFNENPDSKIKKVFLCDIKDQTVKYIVRGLKKYFHDQVKILARIDQTPQNWKPHDQQPGVRDPGRMPESRDRTDRFIKYGNITVRVIKGQLARQKVDVIVNSTSRELNLENGMVSRSLLTAGGQTLQTECSQNYPSGIKEGEVAITSGGQLACKHVFHGCLPAWHHDQSSIKVLETFVTECLNIAENKHLKTLAFPSLGTGKLGYPVDKVAKQMFSCVESFSSSKSSIKEVLFVVYHEDHRSIQAFDDEYKKKLGVPERAEGRFNQDMHYRPQTGRGRPTTARPTTSHGRRYNVKLGKIEVKIYQGDITTANVDVVVYSSNTQCDLRKGAVAQAIMKKGGNDIITEVNKQKDNMEKEGLVVSTGGNLPCSKLIHLDMQETKRDLKTKIFQVLKKCDELQKQTVALPALGTANANMTVAMVARDMLGVITNFQPQYIQEVHIVIYQGSMVKSFIDATDKERPGITREPSQFIDIPARQMEFGPNSKTRIDREWKKIETPEPVSQFKVTIIAKDMADYEKAIQVLDKHIENAFVTKEIGAGKVVKDLKQDQLDQFRQIAATEGVEITTDKMNGKIIIRGFVMNLAPALERANTIVNFAERNRLDGLKANVMKESVQWYFIQKRGGKDQLVEYPADVNMHLETCYQTMKTKATITDKQGKTYIVDFSKMEEYSDGNRNDSVSVLRKSKLMDKDHPFTLPDTWDIMVNEEYYRPVPLKSGSREYQNVEKKFHSSVGSKRNVVEIQRIQNKTLYQQYMAKKKSIESINPKGHQNEKMLWHGFAKDSMESINKFGFNRSYCGKNATAYGDGVYFARDAYYSARSTYSSPDDLGHKRMYLAQVLTGEYTSGYGGMRNPPPKVLPDGTQGHILYDSVVDFPPNPSMYIIFHDVQAYPQYMIVFT